MSETGLVAPPPREGYSVADAGRFGWSSLSRDLNPERVGILERYLIGPRVLDAGCGGGGYVDFLTRRGLDVTGVDKFDMFLTVAREQGFRGTFRQADLTAGLPFPDRSFDTTYCFDVLEHVDDAAAIRELARVTGRRLIVAVPQQDLRPDRYLMTYGPYIDPTHVRYYTPDSLRALAATVRPKTVEIRPECPIRLDRLLRKEARFRSRVPGLAWVYGKALGFLTPRILWPEWHINLLAVIDLPGVDSPADGGAA